MYISSRLCSLPKGKVMLLAKFGLRDDFGASQIRQCNALGDSKVTESVIHGVSGLGQGRRKSSGLNLGYGTLLELAKSGNLMILEIAGQRDLSSMVSVVLADVPHARVSPTS